MSAPRASIAIRCLERLAGAVFRYPSAFVYPQILLVALSVYFTVSHLKFDMDRNSLVGSEKRYHQIYLEFRRDFSSEDDLVVVVESEDREKNRQFVERLGRRVEAETNLFTDVFFRGDLKMMGPKALLFLSEKTLDELHETLVQYRPFLQNFAQATNLNSLFRLVNQQFRAAQAAETRTNGAPELIRAIPALTRIIRQANDSLHRSGMAVSPGIDALFEAGEEAEEQQYITFDHGRIYVVSARAAGAGKREQAVRTLREWVGEIRTEVPGVNAGLTGEPVLELDEMTQSQADSTVATVVSLLLTALIFVTAYREIGRPLKAVLCLLVGLCYTMGFTTLVVGHLNILTITFLPILIGLAIDFGIHLITRYEEELGNGTGRDLAMRRAMVNTGLGIFTGCFTTAGAFFAMALTDFDGIEEMGIITGGGMLLSLVPMITLLPVLLRKEDSSPAHPSRALRHLDERPSLRTRLERFWIRRPGLAIGLTVGLCLVSAFFAPRVSFDYNLLNMQSEGLSSVIYEKKLINSGSKSVVFGVVIADSIEEARRLQPRLEALPTVASVDGMAAYLGGDAGPKLARISAIKREAAAVQFAEPGQVPTALSELGQTFFFTQGYLGAAASAVRDELKARHRKPVPEDSEDLEGLEPALRNLKMAISHLRRDMNAGDHAQNQGRLSRFERALFGDIRDTFQALQHQNDSAALRVQDLPEALRHRFVSGTGRHLLQVYPRENVWEHDAQKRFVEELRTITPEATGTPVQLLEYTTLLKKSYETAALYALGAIVVMVLIHFRRVTLLLLALVPVAIGTLWLLGLMGALGIPFNPANIMTLPLVIGIGVTNGIHILNRFGEEQRPEVLAKSTGKAVLVSGLTTVAGFGSLIPAGHQGISSLGVVMAVGITACMMAALIFLPAFISMLMTQGWVIRKPSADNAQAALGLEEPR